MLNQKISQEELQQRLVQALFSPAVTLAMRYKLPLAWLKRTMETAYFQEARAQGLSLRDVCALMDISISKAAMLSKQLRRGFIEDGESALEELTSRPAPQASLSAEESAAQEDAWRMGLTQRIEYILCAGALTINRLNQILPEAKYVEIEQALDTLIKAGRVRRLKQGLYPRYELLLDTRHGEWMKSLVRVKGLRRALEGLPHAASARFEDHREEADLVAHQIKARPEDLKLIKAFVEDELNHLIEELGRRAQDDPRALTVHLGAFWSNRLHDQELMEASLEATRGQAPQDEEAP